MDAIFSAFLAVTIGTYFGLVFSWLLFVLLPQVSYNIASELSSSGPSEMIREVEEDPWSTGGILLSQGRA